MQYYSMKFERQGKKEKISLFITNEEKGEEIKKDFLIDYSKESKNQKELNTLLGVLKLLDIEEITTTEKEQRQQEQRNKAKWER